ncbi:MAG: HAD-IIA family hydrolase [Acidimicrobiales bacterium]
MTTWALDLDGVLWTGKDPIAGSADAVSLLRQAGHDVIFVTNNSFATIAEQEAKLASFGIEAAGHVVSSAQAGASLVEAGERVYVLGGPGVVEAVEARGAVVVDTGVDAGVVDAVLVGLDWGLTYHRLLHASQHVREGARFVATNADSSYPTEHGLYPGAGSLVAAVAVASGGTPVVAGKPHAPIAELVKHRFGTEGIMVGDRADTDGRFARSVGYRFGLVFSGVMSRADLPTDPMPDVTADDLYSLVLAELG